LDQGIRLFDNLVIFVLVVALIALFAALAGSVGIGGGAFFGPILILFGGLSIFVSVPLAISTTLGVGLASTIVNAKKKTINYRIALVLEPFTILGTIVGVQLHLSASEWIITLIFICILYFITLRSYTRAKKIKKLIDENNGNSKDLNFTKGFINKKYVLLGISGAFTAGVISALIGIGGGLIKVPLMNELGLSPIISSGTGSFMVLFTSTATIFQYFLYDKLDITYGLVFFAIGFIASFGGTLLARYIDRPEVTQYLLTMAIAGASLLITLKFLFP